MVEWDDATFVDCRPSEAQDAMEETEAAATGLDVADASMREVAAACRALEVEPDASSEDIRKSFRRLSLRWHPDKCDGDDERFRLITRARDILTVRSEREQHEAAERSEFESMPVNYPGRPPPAVEGGAYEPPVAGSASKGWGPCPACGGCKRHVGGRACPIYGRWFDTERRLNEKARAKQAAAPPEPIDGGSAAAAVAAERTSGEDPPEAVT